MNTQKIESFFPATDPRNIARYRRESSFWKEISLIDLAKGRSVAAARFYGAGSVVYCVLWTHGYAYGLESARGYGKAGGSGYHKPSAALQEAMTRAGIKLAENIGGCGDQAMQEALLCLAAGMGVKRPYIHNAHA